jgi:hypothetical protein
LYGASSPPSGPFSRRERVITRPGLFHDPCTFLDRARIDPRLRAGAGADRFGGGRARVVSQLRDHRRAPRLHGRHRPRCHGAARMAHAGCRVVEPRRRDDAHHRQPMGGQRAVAREEHVLRGARGHRRSRWRRQRHRGHPHARRAQPGRHGSDVVGGRERQRRRERRLGSTVRDAAEGDVDGAARRSDPAPSRCLPPDGRDRARGSTSSPTGRA